MICSLGSSSSLAAPAATPPSPSPIVDAFGVEAPALAVDDDEDDEGLVAREGPGRARAGDWRREVGFEW